MNNSVDVERLPARRGIEQVAGLLTMPDDGVDSVAALFRAAQKSIAVKMFTFGSQALFDAIAGAVTRGVAVRVMLNEARSSGDRPNDAAFAHLRALGANVAWANPAFAVTHEKSVVIDGTTALVATFNFMDKYFTHTRDYGVVLHDPAVVAEIAACFEADWQRVAFRPNPDLPLTFSNNNARQTVAALIDGAARSLRVQHPKFSDMTIVDRLLAAHARGVHVRILCGGHHGISESDKLDTFSALRTLHRAGVPVRRQHHLRLHAKLIVADHHLALIGSMNIDRSAFDLRRELGVLIEDRGALDALRHRFNADWDAAAHFAAPDPLLPDPEAAAHDAVGPDPIYDHD